MFQTCPGRCYCRVFRNIESETCGDMEGSLRLCNVRVGFELYNLQNARRQAQRNMRMRPYVGVHNCAAVATSQ
jgi:hypothetical protein